MAELITVKFHKCGTCVFAQKPDNKGMMDCYGNPPAVMILGATQDVLGRPNLHIEAMAPKVKDDRPACHLHVAKQDFPTVDRV